MKIYLAKAIFINRTPFDNLELDFHENEISVLTAVNGRGKTTILSHIVDAFYEFARPHFPQSFEGRENKFYRVSSALYNLERDKPSFVYLRFKCGEEKYDYIDIRSDCQEDEYDKAIKLENKIPFSRIKPELEKAKYVKIISTNFSADKAKELFSKNILTYFPSYRYEEPGYLNTPYAVKLEFKKKSNFSGTLINPIEIISGLPHLANWIMDVVLDWRITPESQEPIIFNNLNTIITHTLISKEFGAIRFGVGPRGLGSTRIQILENIDNGKMIYPTIFNLSSGETAILCLFGELLRQADNCKNNIQLHEVTGIVLIDEVDKHLHIKLQKEILPKLFSLFPNVQFVLSSHSPFLSMGLAEEAIERSKIIDIDNLGVSKDPTTNELYLEVYNMMIGENEKFKELFISLEQTIKDGSIPLIVTEGKTDIKHIRKAKEVLNIENCDIAFFDTPVNWGDSKLLLLLEQLSKVQQTRKIIGVFDRDVPSIIDNIESDNQEYKEFGNNVYAFCLAVPHGREEYENISIEFYYSDGEIKKENDGKRLYFTNEIDVLYNKTINKSELKKLETIRAEYENNKKIFEEKNMCQMVDWIHSKGKFADLVETDLDFINDFDFSNFYLIFDKIKTIIAL